MPLAPRTLRITYGSFTVGSSSVYQIHKKYREQIGYEASNVEFDFLVVGSSAAQFATRIAAVEAAFRTPRLDLAIANGSNTWLSLTHTTNTGFDSDPVVIKREDPADSHLTRIYTVRINFGMPADNVGTSGRRWHTVNVAFSPSRRRTVTITGVYTAIGGTLSRAQYNANIAAFAASVLTALGGTYELAEEPITQVNSTDRVINFTRIYDEVKFSQAGAVTDDARLVRQQLRVTRRRDAPGDSVPPSGQVRRLLTLDVSYSAWVDFDVSTDLEGLWDDTIKPWILTTVQSRLGLAAVAITMERPEWNYDDNQINASMTLLAATDLGIFSYSVTTEDDRLPGVVLTGVWLAPLSKYPYQGPETWRRTITIQAEVFGTSAPSSFKPRLGHGSGYRIMQHKIGHKPKRYGVEPNTIDVTELTETIVIEFFDTPSTITVGGGGRGGGDSAASGIQSADAEGLAQAVAGAQQSSPGGQQINIP